MRKPPPKQPAQLEKFPDMRNPAIVFEQHSGLLPHPETLKQYNSVIPGAAQTIVDMALSLNSHKIEMEKKRLDSEYNDKKRGQIMAFVLSLIALIIGLIAIIMKSPATGVIISGIPLSVIIVSFTKGSMPKK